MTRPIAALKLAAPILVVACAVLVSSAAAQNPGAPAPGPNGAAGQAPHSFEGDWDLGEIVPGVTYPLPYTLVNGCDIPRPVTVTLPGNSLVPVVFGNPTGLEPSAATGSTMTFSVPPGSHPLFLELAYPPPPANPPGATYKWSGNGWSPVTPEEEAAAPQDEGPACSGEHGQLTTVHHRKQWSESVQGGTLIHICEEAEEHWDIYLCVYNASSPQSQEGGGRTGAKKRPIERSPNPPNPTPTGSPCVDLWLYNEFVPSGSIRTSADCAAYIREQAHKLFEAELAQYRNADPARWAWVPTGDVIDQLSVQQLLTIKNLIINALPQLAL
jgi:hypothetical protein